MVKPGPGAMALRIEGSYKAVLQPRCSFTTFLLTDWALVANSSWAVAAYAARPPYTGSSEGVIEFL
jgi:hypothetical protein